ncbi:hypothetical protein [Loigolactobacillus rennini]|uniref:Uncharacterized protein n=1 Tax=Loigolactobacillus rennini TaxID=238013 RepID=A0A1K2I413_9LACO|nr:hypothetical protein [Loigolactobacillus rennini]SFZ87128.1 hypothetical protein LREN565_0241 [Loigolactobacillus rennini]
MPKIFHAADVDHSTTAQTAELKHGRRKKLLSGTCLNKLARFFQ